MIQFKLLTCVHTPNLCSILVYFYWIYFMSQKSLLYSLVWYWFWLHILIQLKIIQLWKSPGWVVKQAIQRMINTVCQLNKLFEIIWGAKLQVWKDLIFLKEKAVINKVIIIISNKMERQCMVAKFWNIEVWNLQMWPSLIAKAKEGGLDVIQTYVFWNLHEPQQGQVIS